jgi:serine/threonine protein kinase
MPSLIGQSFGRYRILEQLGEGGMATVYKAYDTRLECDVAIKVIRVDQFGAAVLEHMLKRFEREAKTLARLTHPNIVGIIDYGEFDSAPFLVMEFLPGGTLKERLGKPMPWQEAVRILLLVAQALAYSHHHNIIHRDIKPSNILLTENGQPMLSDFGIAKILDLEDGKTLTAPGVGIGTPEYMSPEQGMGKLVNASTDIYSLGIVLYELVTGRKPYTADTPMAVVFKHVNDPLPLPSKITPDLSGAVEKVILKALAKKPEDRYTDMDAFATALENLLLPWQIHGKEESHKKEKNEVATLLNESSMTTMLQDESRKTMTQMAVNGNIPIVKTRPPLPPQGNRKGLPGWGLASVILLGLAIVVGGLSILLLNSPLAQIFIPTRAYMPTLWQTAIFPPTGLSQTAVTETALPMTTAISATEVPTLTDTPNPNLDALTNFKALSDTPGLLSFSVDYFYNGDNGSIFFTAGCLQNGQRANCVVSGSIPDIVNGRGSGTATIDLQLYGPYLITTDQISVTMYHVNGSGPVYEQIFTYTKNWLVVLPTPTIVK